MRIMIKVKKEKAHDMLLLLKVRGFRPEPDHPVTGDSRSPYVYLIGEMSEAEIAFTNKLLDVEGLWPHPTRTASATT